jgi:HSP20 family protein
VSSLALLQREAQAIMSRLAEIGQTEPELAGDWSPDIDVYESNGAIVVVVEVPGLGAEDVRVACKERMLVVSGERHETPGEPTHRAFVCMERPRGHFARAIRFEAPVDTTRARARLRNGLLTVTLPQLRERRGRETVIEVEREEGGA